MCQLFRLPGCLPGNADITRPADKKRAVNIKDNTLLTIYYIHVRVLDLLVNIHQSVFEHRQIVVFQYGAFVIYYQLVRIGYISQLQQVWVEMEKPVATVLVRQHTGNDGLLKSLIKETKIYTGVRGYFFKSIYKGVPIDG